MAIDHKREARERADGPQVNVLVTGGAGYVGSHCVLLLLEQGHGVVVIDNCSNAYLEEAEQEDVPEQARERERDGQRGPAGRVDANGNTVGGTKPESLRRVEALANRKLLAFYPTDLVDQAASARALDEIFRRHQVRVVLHFAAFKSVNESIERPMDYYTNNLVGTINLLNVMKRHGCKRMIFSSSATVYGLPQYLPVDEHHQVGQNILNPYGRTKFMIEQMLADLCHPRASASANSLAPTAADCCSRWNIISLRYFNPVGAHPSGAIGEHTQGVPNNLMPYIAQVSIGKRDKFYVFGNDFDTIDGTGVRDYIHIMDLARGHLSALARLLEQDTNSVSTHTTSSATQGQLETSAATAGGGFQVFNLGTGRGHSVLETIRAFEQVNQVKVPYEIGARRPGDAGEVYADASLALEKLGWRAQCSLADMVRDTYRWQSSHPDGFKSGPGCAVRAPPIKKLPAD